MQSGSYRLLVFIKLAAACTRLNLLSRGLEFASIFGMLWLQARNTALECPFFFTLIALYEGYDNHAKEMQTRYLETSEAAASRKTNIANIRRAVGRDHFINN